MQVLRHRGVGHTAPGHLGHVHRQVAHPLEVGQHPQRRDELPEVGRDRLLRGEQQKCALLDDLGRLVDVLVAGDDGLRDLGVCFKQSLGRVGHGTAYGPGQVHQVVDDGIELFVILIAHVPDRRQAG